MLASWKRKPWVIVGLVLILALVACVRLRLAGMPLERDEGEYAYAGQLLLQGVPPYSELYNMKLPGVYAAYAGIMALFGESAAGVRHGLLLVNLATTLLLFLLVRRVRGDLAGVVAAGVFALLALGRPVIGFVANAEHFVLLPAVGGLLALLKGLDEDRWGPVFAGGVLLGAGVVMKQHGAIFVLFGGLYTLLVMVRSRPLRWPRVIRRCLLYAGGALIPYGLTCLLLAWAGVFDKFWFWTMEYAAAYSSQVTFAAGWGNLVDRVVELFTDAPLLWLLALAGLVLVWFDERGRRRTAFVLGLALLSFAAVWPGLYFREHYFILVLPAAALAAGIGVAAVAGRVGRFADRPHRPGLFLAGLCLLVTLVQQGGFLFTRDPVQVCRDRYGWANPFVESIEIARRLQENTKAEDRVAVLGSEPQIPFYARRRSATGYIYMYPLMEEHSHALAMQEEMIKEIESGKPKYLVYVKSDPSWLKRRGSPTRVFEWFQVQRTRHYEMVGLVELAPQGARYTWRPEAIGPPRSPCWIAVMRRR